MSAARPPKTIYRHLVWHCRGPLLDAIAARIQQLATFPESGPQKPDIGAEVRALTIGNYLVLYRLAEQRVEIVRVVHSARDVSALF
ncbi:type II toxin-antitoxin system RelE/ParE family toxin [Mesorhizobium sp.]|uniref:type II toxin-antitoxin system RelE/ParE family toxin n=1 Tax=Mesorhizobium sp. TaxID=1871066 RepID=UPI0025E06304|nr:type II toxin-antitoxin system RelE/ParE family toxin [Mesorhizobium sp.]